MKISRKKKYKYLILSVVVLALVLMTIGLNNSFALFSYVKDGNVGAMLTTGVYTAPGIQKVASSNYNDKIWQYKDSTTKVVFQNSISKIANATEYDISNKNDGSVMAYVVANTDDTSTYTTYIQSNGNIVANTDSTYLFYGFNKLTSI